MSDRDCAYIQTGRQLYFSEFSCVVGVLIVPRHKVKNGFWGRPFRKMVCPRRWSVDGAGRAVFYTRMVG